MFEWQAARWQPIAAFRGCRPWPYLEFDRLAMQADRSGAAEHAGEERIVAERSAAAVVGDFGIEGRTVERGCAAVLRVQTILTPDDVDRMRLEELRVGKEGGSTGESWGGADP